MSEEHKREFTEEQLRAGEGHIGLQAGYNKGATQSGINIGKPRSVHDWKEPYILCEQCYFYFLNNFMKHWTILIILGTQHHEETRHKWM